MSNPQALPPTPADETLRRVLPSHLDYRAFRRIPHAPDRYALSLLDGAVWDIHRSRFLTPQRDKDGRARYRIASANAQPRLIYGNVITATTVLGSPSSPTAQAHHLDHNPIAPNADRWDNIAWQSPAQNRAMGAKHQAKRQAQQRRLGETNGRSTLKDDQLEAFIREHDEDKRAGRDIPWKLYEVFYPATERQLRRIANGESRKERVAEIRKSIAQDLKKEKILVD